MISVDRCYIRGKRWVLCVHVPGDEDSQLVHLSAQDFTIKNKYGYTIQFEMDGDKVLGFIATQPNAFLKGV